MRVDRPAAGHPAAWFLLLLVGQLASLRLIQAGPMVGYQHYVRLGDLLSPPWAWLAGVVGLQAAFTLLGLRRARHDLAPLLAGLRGWRGIALALGILLTSAALSRDPGVYAGELLLATTIQVIHLGTVVMLVLSLPAGQLEAARRWLDRLLGPTGEEVRPGGPGRLAWILAGGVTLLAGLLAVFAYERHPHVPDEVVYLLQARYLAAGMLSLPLPPVPEAFNVDLMTYQATRWFSPVPPGWPFLLALGALAGVPWLVNPVLGGVNILLASSFLRELYPRRTVRIVVLLLAASPWHLFMAMNLMTHTATLTAALLAALAVARLRRRPGLGWAVAGGIGIGLVGLIRPLEGIALAALLGLWSLGARGRRWRLAPAAALTASTAAMAALVLPYNAHYTGSARVFPIMAYTDSVYGPGTNALGFGANRGLGWEGLDPFPGHGALDVIVNTNLNLFQVNTELHGWATGSLLVPLLLLVVGRLRRPDWWMVLVVATIIGIHALYYFSGGPDFGARYWYLILVPLLVLSARGLESVEGAVGMQGGMRVLAAAAALLLVTVIAYVPWRAVDKYHHYRGMRPDPRAIAAAPGMDNAILLVRGRRHPDYASAVVYNPLDLRDPGAIFAWDRGPEVRRALVAAFPGRHFYLLDGPTVSGDGYVIRAGPLRGDELLAGEEPAAPAGP